MSVLAVSKYIRCTNKEQAVFHKLRVGFSCPGESGRKGVQLPFPQSPGLYNLDESPLAFCPWIIEAFLSCVCWLLPHCQLYQCRMAAGKAGSAEAGLDREILIAGFQNNRHVVLESSGVWNEN